MRTLPLTIGTIHFCGIGGIGMSGIAEVLHNLGYSVQGSDVAESANVKRLTDLGIDVRIGQHGDNLGEASVFVISSAIKQDNQELIAVNEAIRTHPVEVIGRELRGYMTAMKRIV